MFQRHPWKLATATVVLRYSLLDAFVQSYIEKADSIDTRRTLTFSTFGFLYNGFIGYPLYCYIAPRFFPGAIALTSVDLLLFMPFVYFPLYYLTQQSLLRPRHEALSASYSIWKKSFFPDLRDTLLVWAPMHMINFRLVPLYLRMPFMSAAGAVWVVGLSTLKGQDCTVGTF